MKKTSKNFVKFLITTLLITAISGASIFAMPNTQPSETNPSNHEYYLHNTNLTENYKFTFTASTDYGYSTNYGQTFVQRSAPTDDGSIFDVTDLKKYNGLSQLDDKYLMNWNYSAVFATMPSDGILGYFSYTGDAFKTAEHKVTVETLSCVYYEPFDVWVAACNKTYVESVGNILSSNNSINRIPLKVTGMINDGLSSYDPRTDKLIILYYLTVSDNNNNEIVKYGPYAIEMQPGTHLGYSPSDTDKTSAWATENVKNLWLKDIIPTGVVADLTTNITRAEFTTLITKAWEYSTGKDLATVQTFFLDIAGNEYQNYIEKGFNLDIISGLDKSTFNPNGQITRQEAAIIISRLVELKTDLQIDLNAVPTYSDSDQISDWAKAYVSFTLEHGIIQGTGNNMFSPLSNMTREQAIAMIDRLFTQYGWETK